MKPTIFNNDKYPDTYLKRSFHKEKAITISTRKNSKTLKQLNRQIKLLALKQTQLL